MKHEPILDYRLWVVAGGVLACAIASLARNWTGHQFWQDILTIAGGLAFGFYGLLLVVNWHGITGRWLSRMKGDTSRPALFRVAGALLVLGALAAIISGISGIIALTTVSSQT